MIYIDDMITLKLHIFFQKFSFPFSLFIIFVRFLIVLSSLFTNATFIPLIKKYYSLKNANLHYNFKYVLEINYTYPHILKISDKT